MTILFNEREKKVLCLFGRKDTENLEVMGWGKHNYAILYGKISFPYKRNEKM